MGLDSSIYEIPRASLKSGEIFEYANEVAYWRKASWLHGWMVRNLDHPLEDDPETGILTFAKAMEFVEIIDKVLDDHSLANELLPTCSGCFFGTLDYGEHYFNQLKDAKKQISEVIREKLIDPDEDYVLIYFASW